MKKVLKIGGGVIAALVVVAFVGVMVMTSKANGRLAKRWDDVKGVDVAVPWPLSEAELTELRDAKKKELTEKAATAAAGEAAPIPADADLLAGVDLAALAKERAIARGKHLVTSRVGCTECHGHDFGGKLIFEAAPMGVWAGPNITTGGNTKDFKPSDWDRIIRHGITKNGTSATMPAVDFASLSDRDLSDIITFITSQPAVDRPNIENKLGPIRAILLANGTIPISAEVIDHQSARAPEPPAVAVSLEFGKHVAETCVGCHRTNYAGGKIAAGPPDWPEAGNLTADETGLKGWTAEDFRRALREAKSKDGRELKDPMKTGALMAFKNMTDTELDAAFLYLQSLPATKKGTPAN